MRASFPVRQLGSYARDLEAPSDSAARGYWESAFDLAAALDRLAAALVAVSAAVFALLRQSFPQRPCWREPKF